MRRMRILHWPTDTTPNAEVATDGDGDEPASAPDHGREAWLLMAGVTVVVIAGAALMVEHLSQANEPDDMTGMAIRALIALAFVITLRILRRWRMPL
jgi:hypothetical protein